MRGLSWRTADRGRAVVGLYYILQGTAGAAFGASRMTSTAIIGVIGLVIVVLFAFLFLPQIAEMLKGFQPKPPF